RQGRGAAPPPAFGTGRRAVRQRTRRPMRHRGTLWVAPSAAMRQRIPDAAVAGAATQITFLRCTRRCRVILTDARAVVCSSHTLNRSLCVVFWRRLASAVHPAVVISLAAATANPAKQT